MENKAALDLYRSAGNWLSQGRKNLLCRLIDKFQSVSGDVLELGAGAGGFVDVLSKYGNLDVVEVNPEAISLLEGHGDSIRKVFSDPIPSPKIKDTYSRIIMFDVLEHIEDDLCALKWIEERLVSGGICILTVPAYQFLWSNHDVANHHFRRYTLKGIRNVVPEGIDVVYGGYFNAFLLPLAALARMVWNFKIRRVENRVAEKQSSNMPKFVDSIFRSVLFFESKLIGLGVSLPFGLTVICVLRKK